MTTVSTLRRGLAAVLVAIGLLAVAGSATPAAAAPSAEGTAALQDFGACLAGTGRAEVLLLVDQSGSLRRTDPDDARVTAAQVLLSRLTATSQQLGARVDVAVRGFDSTVSDVTGWTTLDAASLPGLDGDVAGFAERDRGFETDYWTALTTARQQLADQRAASGVRCQSLVLFTDGQYELSARTTDAELQQYGETKPVPGAETVPIIDDAAAAQVAQAGSADICRGGGVADLLRSDGVFLIGLGLTSDGVDLGFLSSIVENAPSACGAAPADGLFLAATAVDDLVLAFDAIGDPGNPPQPVDEAGVCAQVVCAEGAHRFALDTSIRSIHLTGVVSAPGIQVFVQAPGLDPVGIPLEAGTAGTTTAGSLTIEEQVFSDRVLAIDVDYPGDPANWSGDWTVTFVDTSGQNPDAVSKTQLTIQADLAATVRSGSEPRWQVGEGADVPVPFDLVRADGSVTTAGDPAPTLALTVTLAPEGEPDDAVVLASDLTLDQITSGTPLPVPDGFSPGPADLTTSLAVTTVGGQVLTPQVRTSTVVVEPPLGFPTLTSTVVSFGVLEGTTPGTADLEVAGPGCVWVTGGGLRANPVDVTGVSVTAPGASSAEDCLQVAEGETAQVPVSLASQQTGSGALAGDLVVHLGPDGLDAAERADRAVTVDLPWTAELERPSNTSVLWITLVVALVAGLGLPIGLMLLFRAYAARFPARPLQSVALPAEVRGTGITAPGGAPLTLPPVWDAVMPPTAGRRRAVLSRYEVRSRAGRRLTEPGHAELVATEGVVSTGSASGTGSTAPGKLPLALTGGWLFVADRAAASDPAPSLTGTLVLVTDAVAVPTQRQDLLARAVADAPAAVESLRDAVRASSSPADPPQDDRPHRPEDPFGRSPGPVGAPTGGPADPFATRAPSDPFGPPAWPPTTQG